MEQHLIAYYLGILIIFFSHVYMIYKSGPNTHSVINIVAVLLIAYYFMNKEEYIKF